MKARASVHERIREANAFERMASAENLTGKRAQEDLQNSAGSVSIRILKQGCSTKWG